MARVGARKISMSVGHAMGELTLRQVVVRLQEPL